MPEWAGRNASDKELDDGMAEVERLMDRLKELMDRFEAMKLAALRGILTSRAAFLNNIAARRDVLISVDRGVNIRDTLRQILEKASAGRAPDDAGGGGDPPAQVKRSG